MAIIIVSKGRSAQKVEKSDLLKEDVLQKFIYDNPDLLPLYAVKDDVRLLLVARDFPTDSGPIDAIGVDQDGDIYCIETKLYRNPDKRVVLAQVLDYAASLWKTYRDFGTFLARANEKSAPRTLNARLTEFFSLPADELNSVLQNVRSNLLEGRFKFVVLMNQLPDPLKDLIVFLNQNSRYAIYVVEVEYYRHDDYQILIPKLYGAEVKNPATGSTPRSKSVEASFFADAKRRLSEEQVQVIARFYKDLKGRTNDIDWGTGPKGSFSPRFQKISPKSIISVYSDGTLTLNFGLLSDSETEEQKRDLFATYLRELAHLTIPPNYENKWIHLAAEKWMPSANNILAAIDRVLEERKLIGE